MHGIRIGTTTHHGRGIATVPLVQRKAISIRKGIGTEPKTSSNCKHNHHTECSMLQCICICHDQYRIR